MIKAIFGFSIRQGKTMAAYRRSFAQWRAPLILGSDAPPAGLALQWAIKPAVPPGAAGPLLLPYDGISLNWFASADALARYSDSTAFATLAAHGMEWLSGGHGYLTEEVVQWTPAGRPAAAEPVPGFKLVVYARRKAGLDRAAFEHHYREVHAPLAREHHPAMIGYTQNFVRSPLLADSPEVDAIIEMQFRDRRDFSRRFYASPGSAAIIGTDVAQFLDLGSLRCLTVEEVVFKPPAA